MLALMSPDALAQGWEPKTSKMTRDEHIARQRNVIRRSFMASHASAQIARHKMLTQRSNTDKATEVTEESDASKAARAT